jgi:uncharacterized membrane protein
VLVEFPHEGSYTVGFLTSEQQEQMGARVGKKLLSVFIPTTPNPTSGFMVLAPEEKVTRLTMSVADGIKYVISLGSIAPENVPAAIGKLRNESPSAPAGTHD